MIRISFQEPTSKTWRDWKAANEKLAEAAIQDVANGKKPQIADKLYQEVKDILEWEAWKVEGEVARRQAIQDVAQGKKPDVDEKLYKRMKHVLMAASNNKCAYCETKIGGVDQPGDVEHFRPKGRIIDEAGKPVMIKNSQGKDVPHPGYYWLAYDWKNLLLACKTCNSPVRDEQSGITRGKWDRFPLSPGPGFRASKPDDEVSEIPAFLNPVFDDPEEHFVFDEKTGLLGCKTPQAEICEKWLFLNREGLVEMRFDTYRNVLGRTTTAFTAALSRAADELQTALAYLAAYRNGEKPYALAGRKALNDSTTLLKEVFNIFR
jgi:hypothetical protein